jgi:hypothetical protein
MSISIDSSASVQTAVGTPAHGITATPSSIRRKPLYTYRSPSANEAASGPFHLNTFTNTQAKSAAGGSEVLRVSPPSSSNIFAAHLPNPKMVPLKKKLYPMGPPLPLYHPLGRLAMSLPPLDPVSLGLPVPARPDDGVRSFARGRRTYGDAHPEDTTETGPAPSTSPAPAAAVEKPKTTPRKRRPGGGGNNGVGSSSAAGGGGNGGGGGGGKRKRKEPEEADATYPTKRARHPRAAAAASAAATRESVAAEELALANGELGVIAGTDDAVDTPESSTERRSTRARTAPKRRGSTASEATSGSQAGSGEKGLAAEEGEASEEISKTS